jgi:hypothetical protein
VRLQTRSFVEECRSIDIRRWHREGYLSGQRFNWAWWLDGERRAFIGVSADECSVELSYRFRRFGEEWIDVSQMVPITWSACNFGGRRPWFLCTVASNGVYCGRRAAKLYGAGKLFACRHCYGLHYACQSETVRDRRLRAVQKLRARLGGSACTFDPFPERPKGMHRKTYERLLDRGVLLEEKLWTAESEWLAGLFARSSDAESLLSELRQA